MKTNQQPLPTSPKGRSFLRSKAPSKSGWCAGSSLPFGKGRGWASILCIMLLSLSCFVGEGLGLLSPDLFGSGCFAQVANGTGAGNCLSYDGVNDYVSIPTSVPLNFNYNSPFTIEVWALLNSVSGTSILLVKQENITNEFVIGVALNASTWNFSVAKQNVIAVNLQSTINPIVNQWYHLGCVSDGAAISLYVDGEFQSSSTFSFTATTSVASIRTGMNYNNTYPYNGQIDEVRIWNRALTQTEIRDNMCKKLTGNESGLVGYWRFDEGSGGTAYDASPNGNNGTLY